MGTVIFDISMSLDGFITAANSRPEEPLGDGGEKVHDWALISQDERNRVYLEKAILSNGAVIAGRRTYDTSLPGWGADGPTGPARVPVFVVTHTVPSELPDGGVYTFVTDGIESALRKAKEVAGDKAVVVMGGADIGRQYIQAGLVDEISIHLAPVLFGDGIRMFTHLSEGQIQLEPTQVIETPEAIHLRFQVRKKA